MKSFVAEFVKTECSFDADFGQIQTAGAGDYEKGYEIGYEEGHQQGYDEGYLAGQESVPAGRQTKTGTFTIDTNTGTPTIAHNCGFIPTLFIVYPIDQYVDGDQMILGCIVTNTDYFSNIPSITNTSNAVLEVRTTGVTWNYSTTKDAILTENTATLGYTTSARVWRANFQYGWMAIE